MTDLVVVVPLLHRTTWIARVLDSLSATCDRARTLFVASDTDDTVLEHLRREGLDHLTVPGPNPGDYARKINAGYRASSEPLVFLGADDIEFHPGWFEAALAELTPGIGVVGTNDLGSRRVMAGEHSTHSLVTRDYADRFGVIDEPGAILFEGYHHSYVDDELVATAKQRGAWAFAADSHVEHHHPAWSKAPDDDTYQRGRSRFRMDRRLFIKRQALWT